MFSLTHHSSPHAQEKGDTQRSNLLPPLFCEMLNIPLSAISDDNIQGIESYKNFCIRAEFLSTCDISLELMLKS